MTKPFIPQYSQAYYYINTDGSIGSSLFNGCLLDEFNVALGNCFETRGQAISDDRLILKRIERAKKALQKCRDEGAEQHGTLL